MLREGGGVFPSLRKCIFPHVHDFVHAETISLFCESWPQHHPNRILLEIKQLVLITGREFSILFFSQVEITEISSCSQRFCRRNYFVQVREGCGTVSFLNLVACGTVLFL
jgi:hypothetical protein